MSEHEKHPDAVTNEDPLGLRDLPLLSPERDGWDEIRAALEADENTAPARRFPARWLALAASVVLVAGLVSLLPRTGTTPEMLTPETPPDLATTGMTPVDDAADKTAAAVRQETLNDLIALSQVLETRLRTLRDNSAGMPAESAVYVAELEDLVARVDSQLSYEPGSIDLWGQRVNLLLDLESLFQHQFEREYGRMASL